ncbi:MAG: hypothetical protein M1820_001457 [Bogoriella megaspora]|nr:MAG: hypothetical protein M1820_001457 [Bogoriella megaspora]
MPEGGRARRFFAIIRNLLLFALLYAIIWGIAEVARNPASAKSKLRVPSVLDKALPTKLLPDKVIENSSGNLAVKFAGHKKMITINPNANVFNRPQSTVVPKDDFLGPRPHVDTEADLEMLVEECRGTYQGIEKMRNVHDCLHFLANDEARYYSLPPLGYRASQQSPREAEYTNADGHWNTQRKYVDIDEAKAVSADSIGSCPGPIIPYHTYWTGPATWRVEVFIKSYLYTQNLACSRLWIWLDADRNANAVGDMLNRDPLFARFVPLVERGDITLKAWKFPSRIPLPKDQDNTDGLGYYKSPGKPNAKGEVAIADNIVQDKAGQQWLVLTPKQMTFLPVAVSDAVRFVVLHIHGGCYFDMDVLMMRDMRPLFLPKEHSFAERWAAHSQQGDYNTAIMSLSANSSLSSYLIRGGVRMGLNFHPRVIGRMAWKDGRDREFLMLETAAFDPIWTEFNWDREGRCTVPCFKNYGEAFKGKSGAISYEWESYDGPQLPTINAENPEPKPKKTEEQRGKEKEVASRSGRISRIHRAERRSVVPVEDSQLEVQTSEPKTLSRQATVEIEPMAEPLDSFAMTSEEEAELKRAGVVGEYILEEDKYPASNRTLENFFRGAWTYHVHNQWSKHPEPSSWFDVLERAHDGFFHGTRMNPYGEKWNGPSVLPYNKWPDMV